MIAASAVNFPAPELLILRVDVCCALRILAPRREAVPCVVGICSIWFIS